MKKKFLKIQTINFFNLNREFSQHSDHFGELITE